MSPSIAYHTRAVVGEVRDDNIIEFLDGIYTRLERWRHFENSDDFPKERLATLRIVKSCKSVPMRNAPIFAYPFQTLCALSFVRFTLLTRFNKLWYKE